MILLGRINSKKQPINYENSIKKSNDLSMAKLSHGFTLNQMQLLAYAIYCTQQNGKTEFRKAGFEKKFGLERYKTIHVKEDIEFFDVALVNLIDIVNLDEEFIKKKTIKIFREIEYNKGLFSFKWDEDLLPHIIDLKEKYVLTDLTITAKFKSGFSWVLYDFLRGLFNYWHKQVSKESLMQLFGVENKKTYQSNTGKFKQSVLDVAIAEINEYTELEVSYEELKKGKKIIGFDLKWSTGQKVSSATRNQINQLKAIMAAVTDNMHTYINLKNEKNQNRAIEIIREIEGMRMDIKEPIYITKDYANKLINKAKFNLLELNTMLKKENGRDTSFYYNWLEK